MTERLVTRVATMLVNTLANGVISSVGDQAAVVASDMSRVSVFLNQIGAPVLNRKAALDMSTITAHINAVIEAKVAGIGGEAYSVQIVMDGVAKAGTVALVGSAYTFHLQPAVSTDGDFEALVTSTANLEIKTAGTAATVLQVGDAHAATFLTGGTGPGTFSVKLEKSADGNNWALVRTLTQADFAIGYVNDAVETTMSDANGMPLRVNVLRATLTALESTTSFSLLAAGELIRGG